MRNIRVVAAIVILFGWLQPALASVLIDRSPETVVPSGYCCYSGHGGDLTTAFYFDTATMPVSATITGFAYYTENVGSTVQVGEGLWFAFTPDDGSGKPTAGGLNYVFVQARDLEGANVPFGNYGVARIYFDLPNIPVVAGSTWWFGPIRDYGNAVGFPTIEGSDAPDDGILWQTYRAGSAYGGPIPLDIGDMPFRLYGEPLAVVEPGTVALLASGLCVLGFAARSRQRKILAF